jgi:type I restriction enzyme M protein
MKEVVTLIEKVVTEKKIDRHQGLNAVLDFLIDIFDIKHWKEPEGWFKAVTKAEQEEPHLYRIMMIWMDKVATAMENGSWLDFFGGVYEEMYQSKGKASTLGQFFTPPNLCDLLAKVSQPTEGKISDCACGSGRTLLAGASAAGFPRSNFYIGEDLDVVSVKMCALNLMIHGCQGRVVQHDTLKNPILYDYGFRINDIRYPMPTPFYSLTRISLTKEDIARKNERIKEMYGDNVKVEQYNGYEVVKPNGKPKPLFEKKETECVQSYTQLSLFG